MTALVLIFVGGDAQDLRDHQPRADGGPGRRASSASLVSVLAPVVSAVRAFVRLALRLFGVETDPKAHVLAAQEEIAGAIALGHSEGAGREGRPRPAARRARPRPAPGRGGDAAPPRHRDDRRRGAARRDPVARDQLAAYPHPDLPRRAGEHRRRHPRQGPVARGAPLRPAASRRGRARGLRHHGRGDGALLRAGIRRRSTSRCASSSAAARISRWWSTSTARCRGSSRSRTSSRRSSATSPTSTTSRSRPASTRRPDGSVEVEGGVTIRDLNRACDWSLPDDEANTIAGLVIHEAQAIPNEGQVFSFHGFRFEVLGRENNRLTRIGVRKLT